MKIIGVIPARLDSTRLAQKVMREIAGLPMIQHVWQRACQAEKLDEVLVACDHKDIFDCVVGFGGKAVMTRTDHPNGTARIAEVAALSDANIFVNIQGDEPLVHPSVIDRLASVFDHDEELTVATLAVKKKDRLDYENPNVVKAVCDAFGYALYFSRSPVPYYRGEEEFEYLKHLGLYAYRREFLLKFVQWPPAKLEAREKLEQLRILENGYKIRIVETEHDSVGVDTLEDLNAVEALIQKQQSSKS
ncbi:MAG: 3-deoxy-manno-octulosonate cytidylyltransferase [Candidatus Omnitrophica bacterium]|nr:3-deoxy-manno-octulosonate cytidylyltransferase [Candidatus Omnitrophota bacterium]